MKLQRLFQRGILLRKVRRERRGNGFNKDRTAGRARRYIRAECMHEPADLRILHVHAANQLQRPTSRDFVDAAREERGIDLKDGSYSRHRAGDTCRHAQTSRQEGDRSGGQLSTVIPTAIAPLDSRRRAGTENYDMKWIFGLRYFDDSTSKIFLEDEVLAEESL